MDAPDPRYRTAIEAASLIVGPALMSVGDLFIPRELGCGRSVLHDCRHVLIAMAHGAPPAIHRDASSSS